MTGKSDPFRRRYWNLSQVAAWICLRDRDSVAQFTLPSGEEAPSAMLLAIGSGGESDKTFCSWSRASDELLVSLQEEKVAASGIPVAGGKRVHISALDWIDLELKFSPDAAAQRNAQGMLEIRWRDLHFEREQVQAHWPEAHMIEPSTPPRPISRNDLRAWLNHDVWTAPEAILLLHGMRPALPWLDNDQITTHFLQAKIYLDLSLQAGTVARKRKINGQAQWVDSPDRWFAWAQSKFDIPEAVKRAFLLRKYSNTRRIHYFKAKERLANRLESFRWEEIAVWVFHDELLAWTSSDPDANELDFGPWLVGDSMDYMEKLVGSYFSEQQITEFVPTERWLTYEAVIDRLVGKKSKREAKRSVKKSVKKSLLHPVHPIAGGPGDDNIPKLSECLFSLTEVLAYEEDTQDRPDDTVEQSESAQEAEHAPASSAGAERLCREWLVKRMQSSAKDKPKAAYKNEMLVMFPGLSNSGFLRAWGAAVSISGNTEWSKAGRKSKGPIDRAD